MKTSTVSISRGICGVLISSSTETHKNPPSVYRKLRVRDDAIMRQAMVEVSFLVFMKQIVTIFYKNNDTFETKFTSHASVVQRTSPVESRINLKLPLTILLVF